ncbi:hypothetical protein [Candidatus Colwellia aromaticivorans]|uniref:hypothetical protein n=1 Tax=Candidatus Colwellia aromaticivorans TaxID=2267621 RepID=UPI00109BDF94|nr:hypothetical protein [Candidatus Colwellia aromaticivorans]
MASNRNLQKAHPAPKRANNVFADKQGNVVRNNNDQWQNRSNKYWNTIPKSNQLPQQNRQSSQQNRQLLQQNRQL